VIYTILPLVILRSNLNMLWAAVIALVTLQHLQCYFTRKI